MREVRDQLRRESAVDAYDGIPPMPTYEAIERIIRLFVRGSFIEMTSLCS